jgi:hypothetical protein
MSRSPAFDPSRLDNELDDLLPPPNARPVPLQASSVEKLRPVRVVAPHPVDAAKSTGAAGDSTQRVVRGTGGRPAGPRVGANAGPTVVAVRILKPLYDAVVHDLLGTLVERPSYAQIVAWTCEDHCDDVIAELTHAAATAARQPRGRKLAREGVPLTLRFKPEERVALEEVIRRAGGDAAKITRTAGVAAALRVAVKHGIPAASSLPASDPATSFKATSGRV